MGERDDNNIKWYLDHPSGESKICLIYGPGNSSNEWKIFGDFGANYAKENPTKDHENYPIPRDKFNRQKENNVIVNNTMDGTLLHKTQKVSAVKEAPEFLESDYDENKIYQVENMILEETKEKLERHKRAF